MNADNSPRPAKEDQNLASYIAMVVRNAMEDFHCEHLTDDQMKQLNPIIRNAIYTALHAPSASQVSIRGDTLRSAKSSSDPRRF